MDIITLERAIILATQAHATSKPDQGGAPYILHPLRVMLAQASHEARVVALFHDVLEDVPGWDVPKLRAAGLTESMLEALLAVTKRPDEEDSDEGYMRFVARAGQNPIARQVKMADLQDNLNRARIPDPGPKDHARWSKYERALSYLQADQA